MYKLTFIILISSVFLLQSCNDMQSPIENVDIQGHRGCRGLLPENTIPAFTNAAELGVTTLEMDVVISKDSQVVVSHEALMNHKICTQPNGEEITKEDEKNHNLFQMEYDLIKQYDCGSIGNDRFPEQNKMPVYKPLLSEVIDTIEKKWNTLFYNIELKTEGPENDGIFQPEPDVFVQIVIRLLQEKGILDRCSIQSFDTRILESLHQHYPKVTSVLLIENNLSTEENLKSLSFKPSVYSPYYKMVNPKMIAYLHSLNIKVIPWTINEKDEMHKLIEMGADGVITDYPDRIML